MAGAALAAAARVFFVLTNSNIQVGDGLFVWVRGGGTANAYMAWVAAVAAGQCTIGVQNVSAGSLSESPVIGFSVDKSNIQQ